MIDRARDASRAASPSSSGCRRTVLDALGAAYEQWDGKGWPGELRGRRGAAAGTDRAAGRVHRGRPPHRRASTAARDARRARSRAASSIRRWRSCCCEHGRRSSAGSTAPAPGRGDRRRARAGRSSSTASAFDARAAAIADFVDLKSPYTLGHSRARRRPGRRSRRAARARRRRACATLRRAGLVHDFGRLGVSNAIWDKRGPLGAGEWERVRLHPYLTERMLQQSRALGAARRDRRRSYHERLDGSGYPRGLRGAAITPPAACSAAADAYQAMREPRAAPAGAASRTTAAASCAREVAGRPARRRRGRRRARPRPATGCARRRERPGRAHRARGRGAAAAGPGPVEQGDRAAAGDLAEDGGQPRRAHLRQDRRLQPRGGEPVRHAARAAA